VLLLPSLSEVSSSLELSVTPLIGPRVHTHSRCFFLRPATGVSGHLSLSDSSSSSDCRFSPVFADRDRRFGLVLLSDTARANALLLVVEVVVDSASTPEDDDDVELVEASEAESESDDSRSEWAAVYFVVWISSSSGYRKDTCFCAGNIGRLVVEDIPAARKGLLRRTDRTL